MEAISVITATIAFGSLIAVIYQSINLKVTIDNQIYQSFIHNSIEVDKVLIEYPNIRKYVYDDDPISDDTEDLDRIMSVIELLVDITENIEVYMEYIPKSCRDGWRQFVNDIQSTHAYQYYMGKYGHWFIVK